MASHSTDYVLRQVGWLMCTDGRYEPVGSHHSGLCPDCTAVYVKSEMADQRPAEVRAMAESLRIPHLYVEDCWYSCPKAPEGCCNDNYPEGTCNCGADEHNARVDKLLLLIEGLEDGA